MGIDELDSLAGKRCDDAEADHKERSGKRQPDRVDDLKRRFSHEIHVGRRKRKQCITDAPGGA